MPKNDATVFIGGDSSALQKALRESDRRISNFARKGGRTMKGFAAQIGGLARSVGLLNPALAGAAGAAGIGFLIKQSIDAAVEIDNLAKTAGIGVETFQELQFVADQTGVNIDGLTDGIKELNLRADEFAVTGKGPAEEAFRRLGMSREEVRERLGRPVEFMDEILERTAKLQTAGQVRVFDEIFGGTAGEQFTRLIDEGTGALGRMRAEARELGLIIDAQTIQNARQAQREFSKLAQVIQVQLTKAIVDLAPEIKSLAVALRRDVFPAIRDGAASLFPTVFGNVKELSELIQKELEDIKELAQVDLSVDVKTGEVNFDPSKFKDAEGAIKSVGDAIRRLEESGDERGARRLAKSVEDLDEYVAALRKRLLLERSVNNEVGNRGSGAAAEADRLLNSQIKETIENLEFEQAQLGRTTAEQKAYSLAKSLAVTDVEKFVKAVLPAAKALDAEAKATKRAADAKKKAERASEKLGEEGKRVFEQTRTAAEKYALEIERLNKLLSAGAINQDTFNRAAKQAQKDLDEANESASAFAETMNQVGITIGDAFVEAIQGGESFMGIIDGLARDIERLILQMIVLNSVKGALEEIGIDTGRSEDADDGIVGELGGLFKKLGFGGNDGSAPANAPPQITAQPTGATAQDAANCVGASFTEICDEFAGLDPGETTEELEAWLGNMGDSFTEIDPKKTTNVIDSVLDEIAAAFSSVGGGSGGGGTEDTISSIAGMVFGFMGGDAGGADSSGLGPQFTGTGAEGLAASGSFAKGGAFMGSVEFMARGGMLGDMSRGGGILRSPTLFTSSGGLAVAGEAGDEAVMPLRRDGRGRLGVEMVGGAGGGDVFAPQISINGVSDFDSFRQNEQQMVASIIEAGQEMFQRNRGL